MSLVRFCLVAILASLPLAALAAGGHDTVGCTGCHAIHTAKGEIIFAVPPNTKVTNQKTKQTYSGTTALCLGCHADGGMATSINGHMSHPYGLAQVNAKVAKVPGELLRDGGRFECLGCHDPHPSNPNYKYLRVDTGNKGAKMDAFCTVCHPIKGDTSGEHPALFTSMDETGNRTMKAKAAAAPGAAPATAPAAAPAPAAKKK